MKVLQLISTAYRATMEEQDDTVVWLTHAMRGAGGDLNVLLCGNSVNYAVTGQNAAGLSFGDWQQTQPPRLARDIAALVAKEVDVFLVEDDMTARGITNEDLVDGVQRIARDDIADLLDRYDQIWQW